MKTLDAPLLLTNISSHCSNVNAELGCNQIEKSSLIESKVNLNACKKSCVTIEKKTEKRLTNQLQPRRSHDFLE